MLSAISEPVVGAAVVRSYAVEDRTQARIDEAIDEYKAASTRAQGFTVVSFSLGGISAGLANAGVLIVGIWLGVRGGDITAGKVLAFAFLVTLFVGPVQMGTQILTDAQNAIAGWRRVIGILETPGRPGRPGAGRRRCCRADRSTSASSDVDVRLPGRAAGAARHRPRHRRRHPRRGRRRDRLRQVDDRQAADPADGPVRAARCCSTASTCATIAPGVAAAQRRAGAAGGLPLRRHPRRQRPLRPARRDRRGDPAPAPTSSASATGWPGCRAASTPGSASAASRCRRGSASWSRCCGPTSPTPTCWSSTRRPARSTRRSRCGSAGPWSG